MNARRLSDARLASFYEHDLDPWGFSSRPYERRKYELTMAALPRAGYDNAFEPGCSIGVLSALLASRCTNLLSMEPVSQVADMARERLSEFPRATVTSGAIPDIWPEESFDLIVLSELLYYLSAEGLEETFAHVDRTLLPGGHLVAVHYRGKTDYLLSGDEVHGRLAAHADRNYSRVVTHEEGMFFLDVYERCCS